MQVLQSLCPDVCREMTLEELIVLEHCLSCKQWRRADELMTVLVSVIPSIKVLGRNSSPDDECRCPVE